MTQSTIQPAPRTRDVVLEQIRAVGLSLRREGLILVAIAVAATVAMAYEIAAGEKVRFEPGEWSVPALAALLFPIAVWKREKPFGPAFLWTLPVDRRKLALAKVFAGWVWLAAAVAGFVLWLLTLTFVSGSPLFGERIVHILPAGFDVRAVDPATLQNILWTPSPLFLLVPFAATTAMYLLGSAVWLGLRHPLRWVLGAFAALFTVGILADAVGRTTKSEWLIFAASRLLRAGVRGRYGFETLMSSRFRMRVTLPTGETVSAWDRLPDVAPWATTASMWLAAGLIALLLAASRHRERRPS